MYLSRAEYIHFYKMLSGGVPPSEEDINHWTAKTHNELVAYITQLSTDCDAEGEQYIRMREAANLQYERYRTLSDATQYLATCVQNRIATWLDLASALKSAANGRTSEALPTSDGTTSK